jgi:protein-glucosylgalactosylhydroxylysine glucosidase
MKYLHLAILICAFTNLSAQPTPEWSISATTINPNNYFGVTLANGMIGIVSSPRPMRVQDVVLNGVYDYYQRGRVSNILKTFNHLNMNLDVDGMRTSQQNISNYKQVLDMRKAVLTFCYCGSPDLQSFFWA